MADEPEFTPHGAEARRPAHPRVNNGTQDYMPPHSIYLEAYAAADEALHEFVVTLESGERKRMGDIIDAKIGKFDEGREARFDAYLHEMKNDAILALRFSDAPQKFAANTIQSFLSCLGLLPSDQSIFKPVPEQFQAFEREIYAAAKTAYDKAVAADRAKGAGATR
jgi:hypothetical protein